MSIEFTRIKRDVNGNPRYVCSWTNLVTTEEIMSNTGSLTLYALAVKRANKIGGRKYHTRSYGGGIVFQSYNIRELERDIEELVKKESEK